jgi:hypothetical protein
LEQVAIQPIVIDHKKGVHRMTREGSREAAVSITQAPDHEKELT